MKEYNYALQNADTRLRLQSRTQNYGVTSGKKSILRFRGLRNTSPLRKLFFESLSVVIVRCLRVNFLSLVYLCMTNHNFFSLIDAFFFGGGSKVVVEWFALQICLR